jgi:hypothetical protein
MACPLYSKREQECLLLDQVATEDEDSAGVEGEPIRPESCLGEADEYRACPVFRRHEVEASKAF